MVSVEETAARKCLTKKAKGNSMSRSFVAPK